MSNTLICYIDTHSAVKFKTEFLPTKLPKLSMYSCQNSLHRKFEIQTPVQLFLEVQMNRKEKHFPIISMTFSRSYYLALH